MHCFSLHCFIAFSRSALSVTRLSSKVHKHYHLNYNHYL